MVKKTDKKSEEEATKSIEKEHMRRVTGKDDYFIGVSRSAASRSKCLRSQVGCVIANEDGIISVGYNGAPKGAQHCGELGCAVEKKEYCRGVHAEANAISQAACQGISTKGATLYIVSFRCNMCARSIVNAGIKKIVCYIADDTIKEFLNKLGVEVKAIGRQQEGAPKR